jgi:hypothetical protein
MKAACKGNEADRRSGPFALAAPPRYSPAHNRQPVMVRIVPALLLLMTTAALAESPVMVFSSGADQIGFGPRDIAKAEAQLDPVKGAVVVGILMSPAKGREFTRMTREHTGEVIDVHVCGRLIISPRVLEPVYGGSVYLLSGLNMEETRLLAEKLKTGRCDSTRPNGEDSGDGKGGEGAPKPSS